MKKFFEEPTVEVIKLQETECIMVDASPGFEVDDEVVEE